MTRSVLRCAVVVGTVLLAGLPSGAAAGSPLTLEDPASDFGLLVSPTRLVVQPGQVNDVQHFKVANKGDQPLDVEVTKRDFLAGDAGAMVFQANAPYSASNWVTVLPTQLHLAAGAAAEIAVRIALPANPEPGDHQVALVFMVPAGDQANNIRVNRGVGAPVFITVPGPIDASTEVTSFVAPGFALSGPFTFAATVRDTGTVHRDFRGDGNRLAVSVDGQTIEFPDFTVLRDSSREIKAEWTDTPLWCFCQATVSLTRADGTIQQSVVNVVILPLHLLAIGLAVLLIMLLLGRFLRRRYRAQVATAAEVLRSHDS